MNAKKIINDPIYGLVSFPFEELYVLIDNPWFQRLRRISQMGLTNYVYPGANHSRFSHALGALHLMTKAIDTLRSKGVDVTNEEYLATCQAILLHDIGHGPFSHGLEQLLYNKHHEEISLDIMYLLKDEGLVLPMAIKIFKSEYHKTFLSQLVSSQLDMDRMDYLTRDSYYSGVAEGVIGYSRLISMMNVRDNNLVIEEKAIFSIEKFLVARHFMYWQVYLHKTSVKSERMLKELVQRIKLLIRENKFQEKDWTDLTRFLKDVQDGIINDTNYLKTFATLDDIDVMANVKLLVNHPDFIVSYLSKSILHRRLFALEMQNSPFKSDQILNTRLKVAGHLKISKDFATGLVYAGNESTQAYNNYKEDIRVLKKDGKVYPLSEVLNSWINVKKVTKFYLCYPRIND